MLAKTLTLMAAVAAAGYAMKRFMELRQQQTARVKPHRRDNGQIRTLRQDPKTGEYYVPD